MILVLISLVFASASFQKGDPSHSIFTTYLKNSFISGWVNLSFNGTSLNSAFTDSFGNSITLENLLKTNENSNFNYDCETENCTSTYEEESPFTTKSFIISDNSSQLIGFVFNEEITEIESINFNLTSNAPDSCENQIKIDVLNDGITDFSNNKSSDYFCLSKYKGCYTTGNPGNIEENQTGGITGNAINDPIEILIGQTPLCQKITFPEGTGFMIGAWVREKTAGTQNIVMEIYNLGGSKIRECNLSKQTMGTTGIYVGCNTNYSTTEPTENYVCVHSASGTGEYKTRGYALEEGGCGFYGYPPEEPTSAYDIFIQKKNYANPGTLYISNTLQNGKNFASIVEEYIIDNYGSLDCFEGCIVPIKISSFANQTATVGGLSIYYNSVGLPGMEENQFYTLTEIPSKINANFQKLYLDGKFNISGTGEKVYSLSLNGNEIFQEDLDIKDISMDISPLITTAAVPIEFNVEFEPEQDIQKYSWEFGDGSSETTEISKVEHTYSSINNYTLKITVTTEENETLFKSFNIIAESPENVINKSISQIRTEISDLNRKINTTITDGFSKEALINTLKLDEKENEINQLEQEFNNATSDEEFISIAQELYSIRIPDSISYIPLPEKILVITDSNADINFISQVTGETYNTNLEQEYKDALIYWVSVNANATISTKTIILSKNGISEESIGVFEVKIDNLNEDIYLAVPELTDLYFGKNSTNLASHQYMKFDSNSIKFSNSEILISEDLPIIIFPKLSLLGIQDNDYEPPEERNKIPWLWIALGIIVIVGIIVYILLYKWYKNKYENKLFPNKNDLYNLGHYIDNEKRKGSSDSEIRKNLRKANWSGEQITYAVKKYFGKNTGMASFSKRNDANINKQ